MKNMFRKRLIIILPLVCCMLLAGCRKEPLETGGRQQHTDPGGGSSASGTLFDADRLSPASAASDLLVHNTVSLFWESLTRGNYVNASKCVTGNAAAALQVLLAAYDPAGSMIRTYGLTLSEQMQVRADTHSALMLRSCFRSSSIESVEKLSATQYIASASVSCVDRASFEAVCAAVTYEDLLLPHAQDAARVAATEGEAAAYEYLITLLLDHLDAQLGGQIAALPEQAYPATMNIELVDGRWLITELQLFNG